MFAKRSNIFAKVNTERARRNRRSRSDSRKHVAKAWTCRRRKPRQSEQRNRQRAIYRKERARQRSQRSAHARPRRRSSVKDVARHRRKHCRDRLEQPRRSVRRLRDRGQRRKPRGHERSEPRRSTKEEAQKRIKTCAFVATSGAPSWQSRVAGSLIDLSVCERLQKAFALPVECSLRRETRPVSVRHSDAKASHRSSAHLRS
jgi:hypothetical protein